MSENCLDMITGGGFVMLWSKTLRSSIWINGTKEDRLLWFTLLMMKDSEGRVYSSLPGLAHTARLTVEECLESLGKFLNDDPDDTSGVEGGRKLREIEGGWEVVNHDLYRFSTAEKREFWRQQKEDQRNRKKSEAEARAFEQARAKEYRKRRKTKREIKRAGAMLGGSQAIQDGMKDALE